VWRLPYLHASRPLLSQVESAGRVTLAAASMIPLRMNAKINIMKEVCRVDRFFEEMMSSDVINEAMVNWRRTVTESLVSVV
jgi:hypothetical protein